MEIYIPNRGYSIECDEDSEELSSNQIVVLGNYSKSKYNATAIVSKFGIAPVVRENHGQVTAILVDDLYANRVPRIYRDFCPTLRGERNGLKIIENNK